MIYVSLHAMARLRCEIMQFLSEEGFHCEAEIPDGICPEVIRVIEPVKWIMPLEITAKNPEEAAVQADKNSECIAALKRFAGEAPLIISEDRWRSRPEIIRERLLAHLGRHSQIYARNCEVRRIDKPEAAAFLRLSHSYGDAACRYRYGLFLKRHTGHLAGLEGNLPAGTLVAVATFSNARKWTKADKTIRSYEWTRYSSFPGLRVNGGMGKLLKAFICDVNPDDIMSYADLEWSEGNVYTQLGFSLEGHKGPVCFKIDTSTWQRKPLQTRSEKVGTDERFFMNSGSAKYRLKLTEYE